MLALAALAAHRRVPFTYHTKPLPRWLRNEPIGNLAAALSLGMRLQEHPSAARYAQVTKELAVKRGTSTRFVPQGGAWPDAEQGVASENSGTRTTHLKPHKFAHIHKVAVQLCALG
jgi:1-aminocyclopropane-1-carboxylate deaminase